jgi:hypothetical protein
MNNPTQTTTPRPTSSDVPQDRRNREMPLLFQLADVNRQAEAKPTPVEAPTPAPIEAPPLPGQFPASSFPLASSLFTSGQLNPWPTPPGLFETGGGSFSTSALSLGSSSAAKEAPAAESTGLPGAIDAAVKAAASLDESTEPTATAKAPAPEPSAPAPEPQREVTTEPIAQATPEPAAIAKPKTPAEPAPSATPTQVEATTARSKSTPPAGEISTAPKSITEPAQEPTAKSVDAKPVDAKPADAKVADTKPVAVADKPSPGSLRRQRAEARQQKINNAANGDWLQTHGKIIAIGFVIALIATIYLARRNRPTEAPSPLDAPPGLAIDVPGENQNQVSPERAPVEVANTAPRLTEPPRQTHDAVPSPATTELEKSPATATAELQPPVVPSSTQPTHDAPPTSEPLFPWRNETRTATAPPDSGTVQPTTAPETPNAPALNAPTYPETNLRDAPLLPPAPPDSPATSSGPASPPSGGELRGPSTARSYPASFTSAPGGNRYERTGSGLY